MMPVARPPMLTGTQVAHTGSSFARRCGQASSCVLSSKIQVWPLLAAGHCEGPATEHADSDVVAVEKAWWKCAWLESARSSSEGTSGATMVRAWRTMA